MVLKIFAYVVDLSAITCMLQSISECQLALMFLNTLHPWVVQLKNANDAREIMRTIPPLMWTVFLVWMNSQ